MEMDIDVVLGRDAEQAWRQARRATAERIDYYRGETNSSSANSIDSTDNAIF